MWYALYGTDMGACCTATRCASIHNTHGTNFFKAHKLEYFLQTAPENSPLKRLLHELLFQTRTLNTGEPERGSKHIYIYRANKASEDEVGGKRAAEVEDVIDHAIREAEVDDAIDHAIDDAIDLYV